MKGEIPETEDSVMKSETERIDELHKRVRKLRRQQDRRGLVLSGGASALLAVILIAVMLRTDRVYQSITGSSLAGASLLSESAGGYVLAAVIAFFVGVILTVVIYRSRKKH